MAATLYRRIALLRVSEHPEYQIYVRCIIDEDETHGRLNFVDDVRDDSFGLVGHPRRCARNGTSVRIRRMALEAIGVQCARRLVAFRLHQPRAHHAMEKTREGAIWRHVRGQYIKQYELKGKDLSEEMVNDASVTVALDAVRRERRNVLLKS